ncbi:MAG: hypothetical protein CMJ49_11945 [Planctomycetaceae bacterium]|nr:hypothetical protein [Planctomycetaceae bacterium]
MPRYRIQRPSHEPRIEMTPLLDVIFLLLTFFIFALVLMVRAHWIPVTLAKSDAGVTTGRTTNIVDITLDAQGKLYINREPITEQQLRARIIEIAKQPDKPNVYLALDQNGTVDRAPIYDRVLEMILAAGIDQLNLIRQPDAE